MQISLAMPLLDPSSLLQEATVNSSFPGHPLNSGIPYPPEPWTTVCSLMSLPALSTLLKLKHLIIPCVTTLCPASFAWLQTLDLTAWVLPLSNTLFSVYGAKNLRCINQALLLWRHLNLWEKGKSWCQHCCQNFIITREKGLQWVNYTFIANNLHKALYTFFSLDLMDGLADKNQITRSFPVAVCVS